MVKYSKLLILLFILLQTEFDDHPPSENILPIGRTKTFTCLPTGGRANQWFKSDTSISIGSVPVGECNCDFNFTALTFRVFQPSDAGNYSCRINRGGGRFLCCNFEVNVPGKIFLMLTFGYFMKLVNEMF